MCSLLAVSLGVQGVSTVMGGIAQKKAADARAAANQQSADAAERAAADAIDRGNLKELQVAMRGSEVVAAQRVRQSGSGVDINTGGARAVQEGTAAVTDLDRATVRRNAALEAYGMAGRARGFRQEAEFARAEGDNAMLGTFLSGIGKIAGEGGKFLADRASVGVSDSQVSSGEELELGALGG